MAAAAAASLHFSSSLIANPSLVCSCRRRSLLLQRRIPFIRAYNTTSTEPTEFNISFSRKETLNLVKDPPSPTTSGSTSQPLLVPWVVRDEDGNLKLHSKPPASLLHAMLDEKTAKKKKTTRPSKVDSAKPPSTSSSSSSEPKYSKAARRFYNQNFRQPPPQQRLSKVLAAAGGTNLLFF